MPSYSIAFVTPRHRPSAVQARSRDLPVPCHLFTTKDFNPARSLIICFAWMSDQSRIGSAIESADRVGPAQQSEPRLLGKARRAEPAQARWGKRSVEPQRHVLLAAARKNRTEGQKPPVAAQASSSLSRPDTSEERECALPRSEPPSRGF